MNKNLFEPFSLREIRPGKYAKIVNGEVVGIAPDGEVEYYKMLKQWEKQIKAAHKEGRLRIVQGEDLENLITKGKEEFKEAASPVLTNLVRQILFISGIFAGFIFTILVDLAMSKNSTNPTALTFTFSMLSAFSFLFTILLGAILEFTGSKEYLELDPDFGLGGLKGKDIYSYGEHFFWGTLFVILSFGMGILFFLVALAITGLINSPKIGLLSIGGTLAFLVFIMWFISKAIRSIRSSLEKK